MLAGVKRALAELIPTGAWCLERDIYVIYIYIYVCVCVCVFLISLPPLPLRSASATILIIYILEIINYLLIIYDLYLILVSKTKIGRYSIQPWFQLFPVQLDIVGYSGIQWICCKIARYRDYQGQGDTGRIQVKYRRQAGDPKNTHQGRAIKAVS